MCIIDIVEFIQDYIDCKTYINTGEYFYDNNEDITEFSTRLINELFSHFNENFFLEFVNNNKLGARIYGKMYICELISEFNNKYSWLVLPYECK